MSGRVVATAGALEMLERLSGVHGPLMLFQSGGCCDGSCPVCLPDGELLLGPNDLRLGEVGGAPVWVDREQYRRWREPVLVIDVSPGAAGTLSLEGPLGVHFVTRPPRTPAEEAACTSR